MKEFFKENRVLVYEEEHLRAKLLDPNREFHMTRDQYNNRWSGRTKLSMAERILMKQCLDEVRAELKETFGVTSNQQ